MTRASAHSPTVSPTEPKDGAYARAPDDVALALESDGLDGLSEAEAATRLDHHGPNVLRRAERPSYVRIAVRQLADPLTVLLLAAAAVSAAIGEHFEAGVIAAIVVLNAVLGFFQEAGAERALPSANHSGHSNPSSDARFRRLMRSRYRAYRPRSHESLSIVARTASFSGVDPSTKRLVAGRR